MLDTLVRSDFLKSIVFYPFLPLHRRTMTDVSNLDDLARRISASNTRTYALAQAAATQSQEVDIDKLQADMAALEARVEALEVGTPPDPPDPPDPPPAGSIPLYAAVGATGVLTARAGGTFSGTFTNQRFTSEVSFGSSAADFTNCEFAGALPVRAPWQSDDDTLHQAWWLVVRGRRTRQRLA